MTYLVGLSSIMVKSPLSCIFNDNPGSVLLLSELSERFLRSTPPSWVYSEMTHPQLEQAISPITSSVISLDVLQLLQVNFVFLIFCKITKNIHYTLMSIFLTSQYRGLICIKPIWKFNSHPSQKII